MYLIAQAREDWQSVEVPSANKNLRGTSEGAPRESKRETHLMESFSQEARFYGDNARTEKDADLYRKMDSEGFVFAGRKASSSWRVAPPSGKRFAAHADQNAAQSRMHRVSRETHNGIESCCCRVFSNATRKEHHRSATRDVPLGKKYSRQVSADVHFSGAYQKE